MGIHGRPHVELFFDNVPLEPLALRGEEGQGVRLAMRALNVVRLCGAGARAVGKASHLIELMTTDANECMQFGKPIGAFRRLRQMLADSVIEVNAARPVVLHAAWMLDAGHDARSHRIFDGTSEIHRTAIARGVMKQGAALSDLHRR